MFSYWAENNLGWETHVFQELRWRFLQRCQILVVCGSEQLVGRIPGFGVRPPGPQVWIHCFCTHFTSQVTLIQFAQVLKLFPYTVKWGEAILHQRLSWELVREWKGLDKSRHFGHNRSCQPLTLHAGSSGADRVPKGAPCGHWAGPGGEATLHSNPSLHLSLTSWKPLNTSRVSSIPLLFIGDNGTYPWNFYGITKSMWTVSA